MCLKKSHPPPTVRRGFTLIETLVVISIIGMLMGLLFPALHAAREAGRRVHCQNNLKQISLAMLHHEHVFQRFPTGGWGGAWVPDPDRGSGRRQPGGWVHGLLPYLERQDLAELGRGQSAPRKRSDVTLLIQMPLSVFNCPTRRPAQTFQVSFPMARTPLGSYAVDMAARADYAANAGDQELCEAPAFIGPPSLAAGDDPRFNWPDIGESTGVCYLRSEVRMAHVRDGASHTYLVAEKHIANDYYSGTDHGDDWSMYAGYQDDTCRTSHDRPASDYAGEPGSPECRFGGPHPGGWNAAFCDGSVRTIRFEIDPELHRRLGNRADRRLLETNDNAL
jgi:prepilin-type N-terminal cleavage/methylation domain-containing protein/prepilin-type processing-associated H-X9-DG protein